METLPATQNGTHQATLNFDDPKMIETLKGTVAAGLNDYEFRLFVEHCRGTGLNPFKKEVWAIKGKSYTNKMGQHVEGKLQIMTGINGFYTIANDQPEYDGMEVGLISPDGQYVSQAYPKNDFIGAWVRVHRKDRSIPTEATAMSAEYDKSATENNYPAGGIWRTMKRVMIMKCAESVGLRKAFPQKLNGMYTQEEMPSDYAADRPKSEIPSYVPKYQKELKPSIKWAYDTLLIDDDEKRINVEEGLEAMASKGVFYDRDLKAWISPKKIPQLKQCEYEENELRELRKSDVEVEVNGIDRTENVTVY